MHTVLGAHWGFSRANGQLGGFDIVNLEDLGDGQWTAGRFGTFANGGNSLPYSLIELYFAGLLADARARAATSARDAENVSAETLSRVSRATFGG